MRNLAAFINFSCAPNLEMRRVKGAHQRARVAFYAKRDIGLNEELGYRRDDCASSAGSRNSTIRCLCGAAKRLGGV